MRKDWRGYNGGYSLGLQASWAWRPGLRPNSATYWLWAVLGWLFSLWDGDHFFLPFCFLSMLDIEPRASCIIGKCSTTELCLSLTLRKAKQTSRELYFEAKSSLVVQIGLELTVAQAALNWKFSASASQIFSLYHQAWKNSNLCMCVYRYIWSYTYSCVCKLAGREPCTRVCNCGGQRTSGCLLPP